MARSSICLSPVGLYALIENFPARIEKTKRTTIANSIRGRFLLGAVCLSMQCAAYAKDDGTDPSVTIEKEIQLHVINPDGSFVLTYDAVLLINEERAVKSHAQLPIGYNRMLETIDVTEAYTQKPDGRKVNVQADQIKDQQEPRSSGAPMFQDTRFRMVIFPEVAVGDRLVLQYKKTRTTPLFPGHFEDISIPGFRPIKQFQLIYDVPEGLRLQAEAQGFSS